MAAYTPPIVFCTHPNSPFHDKYDIEGEKLALRDLLDAENPDTTDPRWPRVGLLEDRIRSLQRAEDDYKHRSGAERVVTDREATDFRNIGALVDNDQDSMTLHTREAYRLFMGRGRDANGQYAPIVGGKRVASALRSSWALSGHDNPYADWVLVSFGDQLESMQKTLSALIDEHEGKLSKLKQRGLNYSVLQSRQPVTVDLGFRSPYGYAVAELIVQYDYWVRLVKTLVRKNQMTDDDGRILLRQHVRHIRSMFELPSKYERWLMRDELRQLSRSDWLPGAADDSRNRVQAVVGIFGEVPREVFTGAVKPRHSQRRANLSEQELKLLQEVALSPIPDEADTAVESELIA